MNLSERISSFELLGEILRRFHEDSTEPDVLPLVHAARAAASDNQWFTPEQIRFALHALGKALNRENLVHWLSPYEEQIAGVAGQKRIGVVMAGNIPAVGFHDFLCVLMAGHKIIAKLSSSDNRLLPAMAEILEGIEPGWRDRISFTDGRLENFDAIIATGSTNTSRYFEFYFGRFPHIIRKNRNSVGVLGGGESSSDLDRLAGDILLYFGMGCRSVSKVYVPLGYDFAALISSLGKYKAYADHNKYRNNYEYNKSMFLVGQVPFIDAGFVLLKEDPGFASRIALLHFEYYNHLDYVIQNISENLGKIQCVVSSMALPVRSLDFGEAQNPALWDYADQEDTMEFLLSFA